MVPQISKMPLKLDSAIPVQWEECARHGSGSFLRHMMSVQLSNGAKIMLLVSGGPTMGQAEAAKEEARKQDLVAQRKLRNEERDSKALQKQQALVARKQLESMEVSSPLRVINIMLTPAIFYSKRFTTFAQPESRKISRHQMAQDNLCETSQSSMMRTSFREYNSQLWLNTTVCG